jgi:hypothetical protein
MNNNCVGEMINKKKILISVIFLILLSNCAQNSALLGPAITFASSGKAYQAGLSYGSDKAITKITGKSTSQNIKEILKPKSGDTEFEKLVKNRITETRKKLNITNQ